MTRKKKLVIISGLAGSGKTIVIHALEDLGYYCIDNLPAVFLKALASENVFEHIQSEFIALGLDSRDVQTISTFQSVFPYLQKKYDIFVLYLCSSEEVLSKRFRETRRQHPLIAKDAQINLHQAIQLDEKMLEPISNLAHRLIDTSELSVHELKRFVYHNFSFHEDGKCVMVHLVSFGFKYGVPKDIDMLFDVRCFKNPFYDPALKNLTGLEKAVKNYVFADKNVHLFIEKISDFIAFFYPLYLEEGKHSFSLGIGCTGGKHRSVAIIEELADKFRSEFPFVSAEHRHLNRG